jgi:hypothetical protein
MESNAFSQEDLAALVLWLQRRVEELERENTQLRKQLAELKDKKPPPPPPPFVKPSLPPGRRRKKPGRPQGHPPALRPPPSEIHQEVDVPLPADADGRCLCPFCSEALEDLAEHERLVEDLPPVKPKVTRFCTRSGYCPHCRKRVESRHPEQPPAGFHGELPHTQLGFNALAAAAVLKHDAGLPYRKVTRVLKDLCGLTISPGALPKQVRRLGGWLDAPGGACEAIRQRLRSGKYVNADETGHRVNGVNHWLWALTNPQATLYQIDRRRSAELVRGILGDDYQGHLVSDFLPTYNKLPYKAQKCIPHLLRDIERTSTRSPPFAQTSFARKLKRVAKDMLRLKRRWNDLDDDPYSMRVSRIADRLDNLAKTESDHKDVRRLSSRLRRHARNLAEFLLIKDLPGDNNAAERAIRPAVVIRKISGGHRGASTARAAATTMSVLRTIRQQGRHLIDTVKGLFQQHLSGQPCDLFTPAAE